MTYQEIAMDFKLPFDVQYLCSKLPDYVKYGRVMAADYWGYDANNIRQESIVRYLMREHQYDAVEISWLVERSKLK